MKPARFPFTPSTAALLAGLLSLTAASADTTLVYGEVGRKIDPETGKEKEAIYSVQRIYIREGMLALETYGESRVFLFDQAAGTVQLIDHDLKAYADLDAVMIAKMAERLTETQRQVLNGLDKKLAEMPKEERETMRQLLDELHLATDLQLSKPPKIRYVEGEEPTMVGNFETTVVDTFTNEVLRSRYFLVDHKTLGMTAGEYATLVEFQKFVRRLFEQTPGMMRRHFGDFEMLAKSGRVPVQVDRFEESENPGVEKLLNHFNREIETEWFKIPEGFRFQSLNPVAEAPEEGA